MLFVQMTMKCWINYTAHIQEKVQQCEEAGVQYEESVEDSEVEEEQEQASLDREVADVEHDYYVQR